MVGYDVELPGERFHVKTHQSSAHLSHSCWGEHGVNNILPTKIVGPRNGTTPLAVLNGTAESWRLSLNKRGITGKKLCLFLTRTRSVYSRFISSPLSVGECILARGLYVGTRVYSSTPLCIKGHQLLHHWLGCKWSVSST